MRILVLSHGHPDLSPGGGERAAYSLFQRLKQSPAVTKAVFAAYASPQTIGHDALFGSFRGRPDEILVATPPVDGFTFQSLGYDVLKRVVSDLIQSVRPDIVHIHHFIFWGVEVFELFQHAGVRVVFTLHEFAAICAQFGQMVKTDDRLCHVASPGECGLCFPSVSAGKFFVRTTILKSLLASVDHFIAPSEFLKERYVAWGIARDRISVIENLLDGSLMAQARSAGALGLGPTDMTADGTKVVFGFFAQINPFKGFDVLLEAASLLPEDVRRQVTLRIHGDNRHYRDTPFHARTQALLEGVKDVVSLIGGYRGEDVLELMAACDWIVVPSIWWENSPVVIQEARFAGRPLICANIGGMAEKIDSRTDLLFPARSPGALADLITKVIRQRIKPSTQLLGDLAQTRLDADESHFARHQALYDRLRQQSDVSGSAVRQGVTSTLLNS
jgi:glycosyltransferase involved in cell wall biosynthesis